MLNTPHHLTPAELARLRSVAARESVAAVTDHLPMMRTRYEDTGERITEPMPWREAIELED